MVEHKERFMDLKPVTMYLDHGNLVVVQKANEGVESGKYVIPFVSSHDPRLGGDGRFILTPVKGFPKIIDLGREVGTLAEVYEYRKSQPRGPTDRSHSIRTETNRTSSAAGSRR